MQVLSSAFPIIALLVDIIIMIACLKKISVQIDFTYFNRTIWMFIVVFGSFFGQLLYFILEGNGNNMKNR